MIKTVLVYTENNCVRTQVLKKYLDSNNITYRIRNVNELSKRGVMPLYDVDKANMPFVVVNGKVIKATQLFRDLDLNIHLLEQEEQE